jgi:hypothetical protein
MTIDQLNKEITAEINRLSEGELGEVLLDDEFFGEVADPDLFLEPPPDVLIDHPDDPDDPWWDDYRRRHPFLLGMYIPMNSPGQVILFGNNLKWFYKSLVRATAPGIPYLTKLDLSAAWTLVRMKTHSHEMFHYYCDVLHGLWGGSYTSAIEEALAVAWARQCLQEQRDTWNTQIGRMNGLFYNLLMKRAFVYRSPGYRDWVLYADDIRFKPALVDYVAPGAYLKLQGNGVDVEHLLLGLLAQCRGGFVERVW